MAKFVKVILLLLFVVALYGVADDVSAIQAEHQTHAITSDRMTHESVVSQSDFSFLPEAELFGGSVPSHHVAMSRVQRAHQMQYSLSLKAFVQQIAKYAEVLSQHQGRIYTTTTYCHPASQYYVFALRRIII